MTVRSSRPRYVETYHIDTEKKIHYKFDTFGGGSISGMRVAAKRHAEKQPIADLDTVKYQYLTVTYENRKYTIK